MAWIIEQAGEGGDGGRINWYFPDAKTPWAHEMAENGYVIGDVMGIQWQTRDDDGEIVYSGRMDAVSYDLNLEDIFMFSFYDCGATSLWCWVEEVGWECIIC